MPLVEQVTALTFVILAIGLGTPYSVLLRTPYGVIVRHNSALLSVGGDSRKARADVSDCPTSNQILLSSTHQPSARQVRFQLPSASAALYT